PVHHSGRKVDGVSGPEPARGQLTVDRAVLDVCLAGDQADGLFLVLVVLQAEGTTGIHVNDLADVLALVCGEDLLETPGLALLLGAVDPRLPVSGHPWPPCVNRV